MVQPWLGLVWSPWEAAHTGLLKQCKVTVVNHMHSTGIGETAWGSYVGMYVIWLQIWLPTYVYVQSRCTLKFTCLWLRMCTQLCVNVSKYTSRMTVAHQQAPFTRQNWLQLMYKRKPSVGTLTSGTDAERWECNRGLHKTLARALHAYSMHTSNASPHLYTCLVLH